MGEPAGVEITMDPQVRRLLRAQIDDVVEADRVFTMLMGMTRSRFVAGGEY